MSTLLITKLDTPNRYEVIWTDPADPDNEYSRDLYKTITVDASTAEMIEKAIEFGKQEARAEMRKVLGL